MNTITKIILFLSIAYFFSEGCAEKMPGNNKLNLTINVIKSYAWINLMPGGKPSFHFSGEVNIKNNSDEPVANLELQQIAVLDDTLEVLNFKPVFTNQDDKTSYNFQPKEVKDFSIAAPNKMNIAKLNDLKVVSLLLKFSSEGKTFDYKIDSVKIEKVY